MMEQPFTPLPNGFMLGDTSPGPSTATGAPARVPPTEEPMVEAPPRDRSFLGRLAMAEWLLKHRDYLLAQIEGGHEIEVILVDLLLITALPTAFYGLVVGLSTHSWARMLTNPFKLPVMLVLTMFLCLPTLYIFSSFLGGRRGFLQTAAMAFTSLAILGVVLAAFAPITWFLTFTAPGAYSLHVLVNVAVLMLGGFMGVSFLIYGTRKLHARSPQLSRQLSFLSCWIVLYGLVGAQMGWLMRPFFSASNVVIRAHSAADGTVFDALWRCVTHLLH
jgi:hypothetical protein